VCKKLEEFEAEFDNAYNTFQRLIAEKKDQLELRDHMKHCMNLKTRYTKIVQLSRAMVGAIVPKPKVAKPPKAPAPTQ